MGSERDHPNLTCPPSETEVEMLRGTSAGSDPASPNGIGKARSSLLFICMRFCSFTR
jgi:hypothetical protein